LATLVIRNVNLEEFDAHREALIEICANKFIMSQTLTKRGREALNGLSAMLNSWGVDKKPVTVAVVVEGGLLQAVVADESIPGLQVLWIDYDTEDADDEDIINVPQMVEGDTQSVPALASVHKVYPAGIDIEQTLNHIEENDAKFKQSDHVGEAESGGDAAGDCKDQTGDGPAAPSGSNT